MRILSRWPHMTRSGLCLQIAATLLIAPQLDAQRSTTRGWSLGVIAQGTSLSVEDGDASSGGALGLRVGYGFNRIVTGFIHVDGGLIDVGEGAALSGKWSLSHGEIGARFHFANSLKRVVPFLETSVGGRVVTVEDARSNGASAGKVNFNGGAFTLGGGLAAYFKPTLALDVGVKFTSGKFTEVDLGNVAVRNLDIDATSFRFGVGLVWWP